MTTHGKALPVELLDCAPPHDSEAEQHVIGALVACMTGFSADGSSGIKTERRQVHRRENDVGEKRVWILYDDRAADGMGTDDASVLVCCSSPAEAQSYKGDFGGMACYSHRDNNGELTDERYEWNWFPE